MTTYLIKASACVVLFYAAYLVLFRHTNRHQLNRIFLIMGLFLSFVTPFIVFTSGPVDVLPAILNDNVVMDSVSAGETVASSSTDYSFTGYVYYSGVVASLVITLLSLIKPFRHYLSAERIVHDHHLTIIHPGVEPFSFFGVLFIRSKNEDPMIIEHEMTHINQRHWIDLLLVEVASIILWFNPIIYFYRRSIIIQHEYIADRQVVMKASIEDYLNCMVKQLESKVHSSLVNNFSSQSIKQRIIMITSTKNYSTARYLIVLPLVALLIMAFATRRTPDVIVMQENQLRLPVDGAKLKPEGGAGYGKRFNPATNSEVLHTGVDFVLATGNSVYAASDGVVIKAESSGDYGNLVIIEHSEDLRTSSAHLEGILVKSGDKVESGQVIGTVGNTGRSTVPHLHFEVLKNGKAVDPAPYLKLSIR